jgi:hypothetical protein
MCLPHLTPVLDVQTAPRRLIIVALVGSNCDEGSDRCAYECHHCKIIG